jgi:hypothetical protein
MGQCVFRGWRQATRKHMTIVQSPEHAPNHGSSDILALLDLSLYNGFIGSLSLL